MTATTMGRPRNLWEILRQDIRVCVVSALAAVLGGLVWNALSAAPLPLSSFTADQRLVAGMAGASQGPLAESRFLELDALMERWEDGGATMVDAREQEFYELGHLPGAVSLPRSAFQRGYAAVLGGAEKARPLVIYCAESDCVDSEVVGKALQRLGHSEVLIFKGGWAEWEAAGLPSEP